MKSIAKVAAPLVLVFAAFGAQASELASGDIGAQPVTAGTAMVVASPAGTSRGGEIVSGDIGLANVSAGTQPSVSVPQALGHIMTVGA